ncbi:zinc ribbon domain-containing protein [Nocardia sp. NPDC057668]|uniref:zinc ribbon domain-containing protein n=1 Tax=Nocardia sp. NPDC057668 TaxID=3346202 RepID=UPI0036705480
MPSYQFDCHTCGSFDRTFSMAEVPAATACPVCASACRRRFGGAPLIHPGSAAARLIDATQRTASEPGVVGAPAGRGPGRITRNPLHRKLPRP